jgi:hypothetical protein
VLLVCPAQSRLSVLKFLVQPAEDGQVSSLLVRQFAQVLHLEIPDPDILFL